MALLGSRSPDFYSISLRPQNSCKMMDTIVKIDRRGCGCANTPLGVRMMSDGTQTRSARALDERTAMPHSSLSSAELMGLFIPSFADRRVAELNLDVEARRACAVSQQLNPRSFADAGLCLRFIEDLHKGLGIDASFGGYLEDRSFLWQGTYLEDSGYALHLGIDFNVPDGTPVVVPFEGVVLRCDDDTPEMWGWGPRIFIETLENTTSEARERYVYVFGHLTDIQVQPNQRIYPATTIAMVGAPPTNGNWFPHLHVQKMRGEIYDHNLTIGMEKLDGYGASADREQLRKDFPSPFSFLETRQKAPAVR